MLSRALHRVGLAAAAGRLQCRQRQLSTSTAVFSEVSDWYKSHDKSFYKFPVDEMKFEVQESYNGNPEPALMANDSAISPGVEHITPPACSIYSKTRLEGTYGDTNNFTKLRIEAPKEVKLKVGLSTQEIAPGDGQNEMMNEYFDWLDAIQHKYVQHLAENIEEYPALMKHYKIVVENGQSDLLQNMLEGQCRKLVRTSELLNDDKEPLGDAIRFMQIQHSLYAPTQKAEGRVLCDLDEKFLAEGFYRKHVPMYNSKGEKLPTDEYGLGPRDVFVAGAQVGVSMFEVAGNVFIGLRPTVQSIVMLYRSKFKTEMRKAKQSPIGDISHIVEVAE